MAARPKAICAKCGQLRAKNVLQDASLCDACWRDLPPEERPATDGQLAFLRQRGVNVTRFTSMSEASGYIRMLRCTAPATDKQIAYLQSLGVPFTQPISLQEASDLLEVAVPISYYLNDFRFAICEDPRAADGRYSSGRRLGQDQDFLASLHRRVFRFIWESPQLKASVVAIENNRLQNAPLSASEVEQAVQAFAAEYYQQDGGSSFWATLLKWFFG